MVHKTIDHVKNKDPGILTPVAVLTATYDSYQLEFLKFAADFSPNLLHTKQDIKDIAVLNLILRSHIHKYQIT